MSRAHRIDERIGVGMLAGVLALGFARIAQQSPSVAAVGRPLPALRTKNARFSMHANAARLSLESEDGTPAYDVDLALEVDGRSVPFEVEAGARSGGRDALTGTVRVPAAAGSLEVRTEIATDADRDALILRAEPLTRSAGAPARIAIRARWPGKARAVFVSGFGAVAQPAEASGSAVLIDAEPRPIGLASTAGTVAVRRIAGRGDGAAAEVSITSPATSPRRPQAELHIVVGESSALVWRNLMEIAKVPTAAVRGLVAGARGERARVVGRDALGVPQLWALADHDGSFALDAPPSVVQWVAMVGRSGAHQLVHYVPGQREPLDLELAPSGGVRFMVRDVDTRQPLTARLILRRTDAGVDPAAGANHPALRSESTVDALRGDVTSALPSGRYHVVATKGIEWSVDARDVDVVSGQAALVELYLRHVVPTPGILGCDLHTHARPSFDSKASPEDTVLSLVAAGIDFAVPTAHNVASDYAHAAAVLELGSEFASVPGVEVTTYYPRFGHFGAFPYPPQEPVPPYRHTNLAAITRAVRADPDRFYQLNHPRLPGGIGYFDTIGLDPAQVRSRIPTRLDFDAIEVYNGFDIEQPARVEQVLRDYWALLDQGWRYTATGDSDSHCLQYHCVVNILGHTLETGAGVGYPRTMVTVDAAAAAGRDRGDGGKIDPKVIIENLKRGHATVTSGPLIDFRLQGVGPGDELSTRSEVIHGHVRVRAAPWIDVTQVQIVVGQTGGNWRTAASFDVPSRPTQWGPGPGTLDEAQARAVRFDRDVDVPLGPADGWAQVIARGTRLLSDALPSVAVTPLAFTNPVYVVRHPEPARPNPGEPVR